VTSRCTLVRSSFVLPRLWLRAPRREARAHQAFGRRGALDNGIQDKYLYAGLIRLHILHHAAKEPIYGLAMMEELERQGYKISVGPLTRSCMGSKKKGYLTSREVRTGSAVRRVYRATKEGIKRSLRPSSKCRNCLENYSRTMSRRADHDQLAGRGGNASSGVVPEGIQKLVFPDILGAGCFANIGIPYPQLMGSFVGIVEITCGALIILGLLTRLAAVPLVIIMLVAIVSTKVPIWLGHDFWIFHLPKLARYGFWSMAHEARADFCIALSADRRRW